MPAGAARWRREALQRPHFYLEDRPAAAVTAATADGGGGGGGYEGSSSSSSDDDGSSDEEEGMYVPASRLPDPRAGGGAYRGELAAGAKARIQASSVHWGTEALRCVCVRASRSGWVGVVDIGKDDDWVAPGLN